MSAEQPDLTPTSRKAVDYYRAQAALCRDQADRFRRLAALRAKDRNNLPRASYRASADVYETRAAAWDALAVELEAFGEQQTEHHEGQEALL